jgi:hypothetical protein
MFLLKSEFQPKKSKNHNAVLAAFFAPEKKD